MNALRTIAAVLTAFALLLLQSTLLELFPIHVPTPALGMLVVLYVGLSTKWTAAGAAGLGFAIGYLFDLVSGAPSGVHPFAFVLLSLFARLLATRVAVRGVPLTAATGFVASLFVSTLVIAVRAQVSPEGGYAGFREVPAEALLTALCAPGVLWFLRRVDGRLDPARLRVGVARRRARRLANAPAQR